VKRDGAELRLELVPRLEGGKGKLGFLSNPGDPVASGRALTFGDFRDGLRFGLLQTWDKGVEITRSYIRLFTFQTNVKELGGPLTIVRVGKDAAQAGWIAYFFITSLISINLAVLNALPIPFLDGGHMAMLVFEKARGRDLSIAVKERILTGGAIFLAALMVLVFAMDIWKLKH
jgi:regulator of sigma E protease